KSQTQPFRSLLILDHHRHGYKTGEGELLDRLFSGFSGVTSVVYRLPFESTCLSPNGWGSSIRYCQLGRLTDSGYSFQVGWIGYRRHINDLTPAEKNGEKVHGQKHVSCSDVHQSRAGCDVLASRTNGKRNHPGTHPG